MSNSKPGGAPEGPFFLGYTEPGLEEEFQVFDHYGQALSYMEAPEVQNGGYRLFDTSGRRALLGVEKWDVTVDEWSPPEFDEMKSALSAYLVRKGYRPPDAESDARGFGARVASTIRKLEDHQKPAWIRAINRVTDRLFKRVPN